MWVKPRETGSRLGIDCDLKYRTSPGASAQPCVCLNPSGEWGWGLSKSMAPWLCCVVVKGVALEMKQLSKNHRVCVVWSPLWWMGTERKGLWLLRQQTVAASQLGALSLCPATAVGQGGACPVCFPCCLLLGEVWMQWLGVAGLCVEVSSVSALHINISTVHFLHYFP